MLHPFLAGGGRLGNKVIQNFVVSWLAEHYDLRAHYEYAAECAALGLRFHEGGQRSAEGGAEVLLTSELLRELLSRPPGTQLQHTLVLSNQYYQEAWVAQRLLVQDLPQQRLRIQQSNPFRGRYSSNSDTFIHVRLGDLPYNPTLQQYLAAVQGLGASVGGEVYIASDSREHPLVQELRARLNATVLDLDQVATIQFGSTCRWLVLSDGTFSWLIGALAFYARNITRATTHVRWFGTDIFPEHWVKFAA